MANVHFFCEWRFDVGDGLCIYVESVEWRSIWNTCTLLQSLHTPGGAQERSYTPTTTIIITHHSQIWRKMFINWLWLVQLLSGLRWSHEQWLDGSIQQKGPTLPRDGLCNTWSRHLAPYTGPALEYMLILCTLSLCFAWDRGLQETITLTPFPLKLEGYRILFHLPFSWGHFMCDVLSQRCHASMESEAGKPIVNYSPVVASP